MTVKNPGRSYILSCTDHSFWSDITWQTTQLLIPQTLRILSVAETLKKEHTWNVWTKQRCPCREVWRITAGNWHHCPLIFQSSCLSTFPGPWKEKKPQRDAKIYRLNYLFTSILEDINMWNFICEKFGENKNENIYSLSSQNIIIHNNSY